MPEKPFKFKEFTVIQDKCAMKVGTDGVLLGAWANIDSEVESILDIGTGSGLIALQMAQRSDAELIDALEIETNAFEQAVENFENSDWSNRLFCYHASLEEFRAEIDEKYDLIISNPPYFKDSFKALNKDRTIARHNDHLNFHELLSSSASLLSEKGNCAFIIPHKEEENFIQIARDNGLYPSRITRVRGNSKSALKRSLLQLSSKNISPVINELTIELERHVYTVPYVDIVKDFYLKL